MTHSERSIARRFGVEMAAILAVLAVVPRFRAHPVRPSLLLAAALVLVLAIAMPAALTHPRRAWLAFGAGKLQNEFDGTRTSA